MYVGEMSCTCDYALPYMSDSGVKFAAAGTLTREAALKRLISEDLQAGKLIEQHLAFEIDRFFPLLTLI